MAREIFLLGCDDTAPPEVVSEVTEAYVHKLGKLGVGPHGNLRPVIFRSTAEPHCKIAGALFMAFEPEAVYNLGSDEESEWSPWSIPFADQAEIAECLVEISSPLPYKSAAEGSPDQQRIIVANSALAEEFMRLNPSGELDLETGEPPFNYAYRALSAEPAAIGSQVPA